MNPNGATGPAPTEGSVTAAVNAKTDAQTPPEFLRPNFERMPPELTRRPIWVLWVPVWNGSKWTKRPIQPSGFGASTTNPKHWSSFDEVKKAYERAVPRQWPSGDLKAVTERAITKMKEDGLLVEGQMPSTGRFRRGRALRTNRSVIR